MNDHFMELGAKDFFMFLQNNLSGHPEILVSFNYVLDFFSVTLIYKNQDYKGALQISSSCTETELNNCIDKVNETFKHLTKLN